MNKICRQTTKITAITTIAAIIPAVIIIVLLFSGCGGGATITLKELSFEPQTVTIKAGETVTFKNEDRRTREIMSGAPPVMTDEFVSPPLEKGQSWSHTFDTPGEYPFHDMRIPGRVGTIIVEE
jgi:plastocyanin